MKYFVESFTGRDLKRLENMDGYDLSCKHLKNLNSCNLMPRYLGKFYNHNKFILN